MSSHILLRSSWQAVNIGDIAHTPGLLTLLETHFPAAKVTLWAMGINDAVREMLQKRFPNVEIVEGRRENEGFSDSALQNAWGSADFFLHGSGPSFVAARDFEHWAKTGKPYGIFGITLEAQSHTGNMDETQVELLSGARFVFTRDTISLENARQAGVCSSVMEFVPDATFAIDLRDDARAAEYAEKTGLKARDFIAAIPRLRYTPYYQIHGKEPTPTDLERRAVSDQFASIDHEKLRVALGNFVRSHGAQVLACPEMTYEVPLAKRFLIDPQPEELKSQFVWRDTYWMPDEAASIYAQGRLVVSFEMHSPILAAAFGVPAIYLRTPTDTCKGQMWRDIGLDEWIFEIDETGAEQIGAAIEEIWRDENAARQKMAGAMEFVRERQKWGIQKLREAVGDSL